MILYVRFHVAGTELSEAALPTLLGLIEDIAPTVQALPPDGALVDVGGAERYFGRDAAGLAALLRVRALAHCGADCTIGVGANPLLARTAAQDAPPGKTLVVPGDPEAVAAYLGRKPVASLSGVGPATARALCSYGLDTAGKIAAAPLATLQRIVGVRAGRELQERARGIDRTPVVPNAASRSLASERRFDRDELDPVRHRRALLSLSEEVGVRLRREGQVCRSLALTVRYADRSTTTRSRAMPEPTAHSAALTATAYGIYASLGLQRARVRAIALRAEGLTPAEQAAHQLTFDPADEKARRIEAVADRARAKFGPGAVVPGSLSDRRLSLPQQADRSA
ncbi:helix-hairpin-helix domain-containing protein [Streptomyces sp. ISL-100]|uniref:DNA polymerase Y family protein n=1 Tax=Streptomyces sp. ISL-100 TaxID=2819173 RepID=UPI001BEBFF3C|nr:helix-hairpin-helix domain-containing protein [Streptomyces sp. ISL-100]MBT2399640.1 hypothetical protein [Streptomyces sp. ISL-100]